MYRRYLCLFRMKKVVASKLYPSPHASFGKLSRSVSLPIPQKHPSPHPGGGGGGALPSPPRAPAAPSTLSACAGGTEQLVYGCDALPVRLLALRVSLAA